MEFNYNFNNCFICDSKMLEFDSGLILKCKNGCCNYDIDPQGENIFVELFDGEGESEDLAFCIGLYERTWHRQEQIEQLKLEEQRLLEAIKYWKTNERYLIKILGGK